MLKKVVTCVFQILLIFATSLYSIKSEINTNIIEKKPVVICDNLFGAGKYHEAKVCCLSRLNSPIASDSANDEYAFTLKQFGDTFSKAGIYDSAAVYYRKALGRYNLSNNQNRKIISEIYYQLGIVFTNLEQMKEAEYYAKEAYNIRKEFPDTEAELIAKSLNSLSDISFIQGKWNEGIDLCSLSIDLMYKSNLAVTETMAWSLNHLGYLYFRYGDMSQAELFYQSALVLRNSLGPLDTAEVVTILDNFAKIFQNIGDYSKAEEYYRHSQDLLENIHPNDHPDKAIVLNHLGLLFTITSEFNKADSLFNSALLMLRRLYGEKPHSLIAYNLNNLASLMSLSGKYDKAEELFTESLNIRKQLLDGDHPDLANTINNLANLVGKRGDYERAVPIFTEAVQMYRRMSGNKNTDMAKAYFDFAGLLFVLGRYKEADSLFISAVDIYKSYFVHNSAYLSDKEKELFWRTIYLAFEKFNSYSISRFKENPELLKKMAENVLFTKAILFNSTDKIKRRIANSGDSSLLSDYRELKRCRELLVKLYSLANSDLGKWGYNTDSLETVVSNLEKRISLKSEEFKISYEMKKINWKTIQAVLQPDEAAVEAVRLRYHNGKSITDSIIYAFIIITDQTEDCPELIVFQDGSLLEHSYYSEYRNLLKFKLIDSVSYNRYWGKLGEKLKGYKKVFFSPDGIYNKLNPSTLMLPGSKYLLDYQDIQQINSIRDLLLGFYKSKQETNMLNNAVLIGNPKFGTKNENRSRQAKKGDKKKNFNDFLMSGLASLDELPGTAIEIKEISKFLLTKSWVILSYTGDEAVKESIKNVDSPRVLHIATHGYFLEDYSGNDSDLSESREQKPEDNPLLRSGLIFSGSYLDMSNDRFGNNFKSALLSSYEAMDLNLDKTELVVLSACETGLGEAQNGEGVYGLRRSFQQAGASTVIMSLWKVNDEATKLLMTNFYKNWIGGMTKREAFAKAQRQVRSSYPHPYYWGAFIMVGE